MTYSYTYENFTNTLQEHYENITAEYKPRTIEDRLLCNDVPIRYHAPTIVMDYDDYYRYMNSRYMKNRKCEP